MLVIGASGMLGHKVVEVCRQHHEVVAAFRDADRWLKHPLFQQIECLSNVDALHFDSLIAAVDRVRPEVVINAAGIIKQLRMSKDPVPSILVNALFPHRLATLCGVVGARFVHISTDCVFSGRRGAYTEDDIPDPPDLYGRTKLVGEVARPGCLTVRTSIVGRELSRASGLLEWFLGNRCGHIRGFTRAIYTGVTTTVLAEFIASVLMRSTELSGVYHLASEPISKYDLLVRIREAMGLSVTIEPVDEPVCDRSLLSGRLTERTGWAAPSWTEMAGRLAAEAHQYEEWRQLHGGA